MPPYWALFLYHFLYLANYTADARQVIINQENDNTEDNTGILEMQNEQQGIIHHKPFIQVIKVRKKTVHYEETYFEKGFINGNLMRLHLAARRLNYSGTYHK